MNYLQNKKNKKNQYTKIVGIFMILIVLIVFQNSVSSFSSYALSSIMRPVIKVGSNIGNNIANFRLFFISKQSLEKDNQDLKEKINTTLSTMANYNSILDENKKLKEILERKHPNVNLILATILSRPNRSPYDTLVIDIGKDQNIEVGSRVFAGGNIPIGKVVEVNANTSKITLFSSPLEKTQVSVTGHGVFMEIVGRGGGNFEMILPRDFSIENGTEVTLPDVYPYVIASVSTIVSDPRDAYKKALLISPINIQELKFVEIEK